MAKLTKKLSLITAMLVMAVVSFSFAQEEITLTTIMPSQETARGRSGVIGDGDGPGGTWGYGTIPEQDPGDDSPFIGENNLIVGGQLGVGTYNPGSKVDIQGGDLSIYREENGAGIYIQADDGYLTEIVFQETEPVTYDTLDFWAIRKNDGGHFEINKLHGIDQGVKFFISDTTGNVGIGTTIPARKLHVFIPTGDTSANTVFFENTATTSIADYAKGLDIDYTGSVHYGPGSLAGLYVDMGTNHTVANLHSAIFMNGTVGIGTTQPTGKLQIENTVGFPTIFDYTEDNRNYIRGITYFDSGDLVGIAGQVSIGTTNSSSYQLYVEGTAGCTDGIWAGSDINWKHNIQPIQGALDKIVALQGVSYEWRIDEFPDINFKEGIHLGVIAQDVEDVFPELVDSSKGYRYLNYNGLIAPIIEAIKELKDENKMLKERVAALERKKQI